jgi:hypothetical protein
MLQRKPRATPNSAETLRQIILKTTVSGTTIFRIEGSKITEEWAHWNLLSMMEQLGINMAPKAESNAPKTKSKAHA